MTINPMTLRRSQARLTWPARARRLLRVPAAVVLVYATAILLGWLAGIEWLISGGPGRAVSSPFTAAAVATLAVGILARPGSLLRTACYVGPMVVGVLVGASHVVDLAGAGLDGWLVAHRPSLASGVTMVALGLGGLLSEAGRRVGAQVVNGAGVLISLTAVFGSVFGIDSYYQIGDAASMSVMSAVGLLLVSVCLWLSVPLGVLQWVCFGEDSGGRSQRGLVPVAFLLVPGAAWVHVEAVRRGLVDIALSTALLTTFIALVIVIVNYRTGRKAFIADRERETLLDELHRVNGELEDRVRTKVHQLNRQKTKLALFEERDRIARDLHDRVIQRIFAAGLQSASLGRLARKDAAKRGEESMIAESLDIIATELDMAIRELRNSIFELTSIGDLDNLDQVVRDIASRASRILGFMPRISVTGQVAGLHADIVAQLASVIQEGLSNVARHAHASTAEVEVHGTDHEIQVLVRDDGVGLPDPLPRSSGVRNLMNRAQQLGGTATWGNGDPTGTVLTWQVPRGSQVERVDEARSGAVTRADVASAAQGNETPVADSDIVHSAAAAAVS